MRTQDPGPGTRNPGPETQDLRSWTQKTKKHNPGYRTWDSWTDSDTYFDMLLRKENGSDKR